MTYLNTSFLLVILSFSSLCPWVPRLEFTHYRQIDRAREFNQSDSSITASEIPLFAGGNGSRDNPFLIVTPEHLYNIRYYCIDDGNLFYFRQDADIDLRASCSAGGDYYNRGSGWEPVGTIQNPFRGSYDGQNYSINRLFINRNSCYQGLFGYIYESTVANLNLSFVSINSTECGTGSVAGCAVASSISNCHSTGSVTGDNFTGGLIGWLKSHDTAQYSTMNDCSMAGEVHSTGYACGGLAGRSEYSNMNRCYFTGNVSASGNVFTLISGVGGLVGFYLSGTVTACFSSANVSSTRNGPSGGFIGSVKSVNLQQCYSIGTVTGLQCTGGFIGFIRSYSAIINCYTHCDVYVSHNGKYCAVFSGYIHLKSDIRCCHSTGNIHFMQ